MAKDARTLALGALAYATFRKSFDFYGARDRKITSSILSYRDALAIILKNTILILALEPRALKRLALVPRLSQLSNAAQ